MKNSIDASVRFGVGSFWLVAAFLPTTAALAAKRFSNEGKKYEPPAVVVPDVDPKAAEQARSDAAAAHEERKKAEDNFASIVAKLKDEFEKSPTMATALADLRAAQSAYDASVKPVLATVHETPEYKAAFTAKLQDESKISELHNASGNDAQISQLAVDAMKQGAAATKLENDALRKDPAAIDAKKKLASAGLAVGKLRAQFNASLTKNHDWQAARKALDDAIQKSQLADATSQQESQKLAAALAAHNAAEARKQAVERSYQKPPASNKPAKAAENN